MSNTWGVVIHYSDVLLWKAGKFRIKIDRLLNNYYPLWLVRKNGWTVCNFIDLYYNVGPIHLWQAESSYQANLSRPIILKSLVKLVGLSLRSSLHEDLVVLGGLFITVGLYIRIQWASMSENTDIPIAKAILTRETSVHLFSITRREVSCKKPTSNTHLE